MPDLGITRKELYGEPEVAPDSAKSDRDKEIVHPSADFVAKQAAMAGIDKLEFGDEFTATIRGKISRVGSYSDANPKPDMGVAIMALDNIQVTTSDVDETPKPEKKLPAGVPASAEKKSISPSQTSLRNK